jgi:hypothetical protein
MKKRSAMTIAAALVASLLAGAVALSLGVPGAGTISASAPPEPRVRTIERTVTIHRRAGDEPRVTIASADGVAPVDEFEDDDDRHEHDRAEDGFDDVEEADDDD